MPELWRRDPRRTARVPAQLRVLRRLQESALLSSWRRLLHLVRRFFSVTFAEPLSASEQSWVAERLGEGAGLALFWRQPVADRRHAHDVARFVADRQPARNDLQVAALLHDVGKRHARLGPVGRSLATLVKSRQRRGDSRFGLYTHHGPIGAEELRQAGYEGMIVDFAEAHHRGRPGEADPTDWNLLCEGDHER